MPLNRQAVTVMVMDVADLDSQAIRRAHGNLTKAALWLGVTRLKMREKLKQFGRRPKQESGCE